jgi:hypothetical protein
MSLKSKAAFEVASKLPPGDTLTKRDLDIVAIVTDYMAQHFVDVIDGYDAEKEHQRCIMKQVPN